MTTTLLEPTAVVRVCVFMLAGQVFALDVRRVREVAVFEEWTPVPLAPSHVLGLANLHGAVMPIVDARPVLGLPPRRTERRVRALRVTADGLEAALVIDGVTSLEAFTEVLEATDTPHAAWAVGLVGDADRLIPLLDASKLLRAMRPGPRPGTVA
jgi:purine-binding chemotaxis protein CheW